MDIADVIASAEEFLRLADSATLESAEGQYAQAVVALRDERDRLLVGLRQFGTASNWTTVPGAGRTDTDFCCAWVGPQGPYQPDAYANGIIDRALSPAPKEGERGLKCTPIAF